MHPPMLARIRVQFLRFVCRADEERMYQDLATTTDWDTDGVLGAEGSDDDDVVDQAIALVVSVYDVDAPAPPPPHIGTALCVAPEPLGARGFVQWLQCTLAAWWWGM